MKSVKILVVEDQPSTRDFILDELNKAGYEHMYGVPSSADAISVFRKETPDIVLMDINLGEKINGFYLSQKLKEIRKVPIIYTTAHADVATVQKAKDTSPDGYLVKPFDKNDLYTAIELALYKFEMYQKLVQANQDLETEISKRKIAEKQLKSSESRYIQLLNGIKEAVFFIDKDWNYGIVNETAAHLGGLSASQMTGKKLQEMFPGVENSSFFRAYQRVMQSRKQETVVDEYTLPSGQPGWFEVKIYPVQEGILCIASDITERKHADNTLKESEEKYRSFIHNSNDAFALTDESGTIIEWNETQAILSGISAKEALGKKIWDAHALFELPEKDGRVDAEKLHEAMHEFFATGDSKFLDQTRETSVINANGEIREIQQRSFKITTSKGFRLGAVSRDITESKRALLALKETQQRYHLLSDVTFEGIVLHNQGIPYEVNRSFNRITGYSREEVIGHNVIDLIVVEEDRQKIRENIIKEYASPYLVKARRKNGELIDVEIEARNIKYNNQTLRIAAIRDVTDRVRMNQKLRENEEKFRTLVESANDLIYMISKEGKFTYVSPNCQELTGFTRDDYREKTVFDFLHPKDIARTKELLTDSIVKKGKVGNIEYRAKHKTAGYRWFVANGSPLFDADGNLTAFMGIAHDVTARKEAELKLKESEERFKSLFEHSNDAIIINDENGKIIDVNQRTCELLKYDRSELINNDITIFVDPSVAQTKHEGLEQVKTKGYVNLESKLIDKQGNSIFADISARVFDKSRGLIQSIVRDITERKKTERQVASLAAIIENSNNIAVIKDLDLRVIATNKAFAKATGKNHENELIGKTDAEIFDVSPDAEPVKSYMDDERKAQTLKRGERLIREEPVFYPDGEVRTFLTTKFPVFDRQNDLIATANISTDITRQKKTLERLKTMLKYAESLAECSHFLLSGDENGLTSGLKQILKTSETSRVYIFENVEDPNMGLCMRQIHEVVTPNVSPEIENPLLQSLPYSNGFKSWEIKLEKGEIVSGLVKDFKPDVRKILEEQNIKSILIIPIFIKGKWYGFIGFDDVVKERIWIEQDMKLLRTVSDLVGFYLQNKMNEQKLVKNNQVLQSLNSTKDKMMSIIGHDLKNPIGQVMGFIDLLLHNYDRYDDEKIQYFHRVVYSSIHQVSALLDNLLQWSRAERGKIVFQPERFNITLTAESTLALLEAVALNKNISLVNHLKKEIWVDADVQMVETVWRNLVSNALKFTDKRGNVILDYKEENEFIRFSVSDTGVGIRDEVKKNIFNVDHSLSTAGTSGEVGTGLGLSISKEFIEKHGGSIWVESTSGEGSTFYFTLPKA